MVAGSALPPRKARGLAVALQDTIRPRQPQPSPDSSTLGSISVFRHLRPKVDSGAGRFCIVNSFCELFMFFFLMTSFPRGSCCPIFEWELDGKPVGCIIVILGDFSSILMGHGSRSSSLSPASFISSVPFYFYSSLFYFGIVPIPRT